MNTRTASALLAVVATLGLAPAAHAAITTEGPATCRPAGLNNSGSYVTTSTSISNGAASGGGEVLCPIVRTQEVGTGGFGVYVDGTVPPNLSIACWLSSYDYHGNFLATVAAVMFGPVTFDQELVLPMAQVPMYSSQVLDCTLPAGAMIFDVEPIY